MRTHTNAEQKKFKVILLVIAQVHRIKYVTNSVDYLVMLSRMFRQTSKSNDDF